jgi:hypothetical protein
MQRTVIQHNELKFEKKMDKFELISLWNIGPIRTITKKFSGTVTQNFIESSPVVTETKYANGRRNGLFHYALVLCTLYSVWERETSTPTLFSRRQGAMDYMSVMSYGSCYFEVIDTALIPYHTNIDTLTEALLGEKQNWVV